MDLLVAVDDQLLLGLKVVVDGLLGDFGFAGDVTDRDLLAKGFGPGFNGPLQLVAKVNAPGQEQQFKQVLTAVSHTKNVASVSPATVVGGSVGTAQVFPTGSPQAASTSDLLTSLRTRVIPAASQNRVHVLFGGQTAVFADFSSVLSGKLPLFIGVVVLLSFVLLMAVFRSIAIPLMAAAMNLLSVGAAFGVVTAVFQDGWLLSLIGENRTGPIQAFQDQLGTTQKPEPRAAPPQPRRTRRGSRSRNQ